MMDIESINPKEIILKTEQLCRQFQSGHEIITVLDQVNIQVPRQSLTMFKGRSGSGKTTLINLLGALDRPTSGQVFFEGRDITSLSDGGVAQMENGWVTPNGNPNVNDMKCTLLGTQGMINIDTSSHNLIQKYTEDAVKVPDILVQHQIFGEPKGFAFESIRCFVDRLTDGRPFPVTLEDAAHTSLGILSIMESAKKREPVDVCYDG